MTVNKTGGMMNDNDTLAVGLGRDDSVNNQASWQVCESYSAEKVG